MPGEDASSALDAAESFGATGMRTVLTQLGEQVRTPAEAIAVRRHYLELLESIHLRELRAQISVKLTHLGLDVDAEACFETVRELASLADEIGSFVWIDMEESWYVDRTLDLFRRVRREQDRVGVCLQAYLRRTPEDLRSLLPLAPAIRLVKGAYRESPEIAFPRKRDTDEAFFELANLLLLDSPEGTIAALGTHDARLIDRIEERARARGTEARDHEIHMLYGIQAAAQRRLAEAGSTVRVLVSYGENWFPWYMRRLAERPANLWFVVKNLAR